MLKNTARSRCKALDGALALLRFFAAQGGERPIAVLGAAPGASLPVGTLAGDEARFTVALAVEGGGGEPALASRFRSGT